MTRRVVIHELRDKLHGLAADVLFLQEVQGVHRRHARRYRNWPVKPQHEFIADTVWHEVAYGRNAVYQHGHHGNAVLSRYPIVAQTNQDISAHAFESRGMLHCVLQLKRGLPSLHCINIHLGLFERGRRWQVHALCERIREAVPMNAPLIIAGDFNDWRRKADRTLQEELGVVEVFEEARGRPARTFPAVMPVFRLDRIYSRALTDPGHRRALRLPAGAPVRPRRVGRDFRARALLSWHRALIPWNATARAIASGCSATAPSIFRRWSGRSTAPSARSGSKATSSPTTPRAGASPQRWRARQAAASRCGSWSTAGAPSSI